MRLREFEKSPEVMPLLVRLYEGQRLYSRSPEKRGKAQHDLSQAVAELIELDLSEPEITLLTDLLISLVRQAERDLRFALSQKLSTLENAPLRLILHLANDDFMIAEPILRQSTVFSDLDLIYIIKAQGAAYWQAIAARENLNDKIIDMLAETKDEGTAIALSRNERIVLTYHALEILGDMAVENEALARPLIKRRELPPTFVQALYRQVGDELKTYISLHHDIDKSAILDAAEEVVLAFVDAEDRDVPVTSRGRALPYFPTAKMMTAADRAKISGVLNFNLIMDTLKSGRIAEFVAFFSYYSGLPVERVHGFLRRACPKGFAIACKALGIQKSDFAHIYLLTNAMRSSDRMVNQSDMMETLEYFDRIKPALAVKIFERDVISQDGNTRH